MSADQDARDGPLSDHVREGKTFRPPLSRLPLRETSWVKLTMPEFLWIGLLQEAHGLAHGVDLSLSLAEAAMQAKQGAASPQWFVDTSSYAILQEGEWREVQRTLVEIDKLTDIQLALAPLVHFYPGCPYAHLFKDRPTEFPKETKVLKSFKTVLESLYSKQDRAATLVQGTAVYVALVTGKVTLTENVSFGNLEALTDYPQTDESQKVGASVRAMCNFLIGSSSEKSGTNWVEYFWDRGFELEPCDYELPYQL